MIGSSESVKYPWAIVPPNGVCAAMSGSTWMKLWSSVTSANAWIFSCVISIHDDGPNSAPTSIALMRRVYAGGHCTGDLSGYPPATMVDVDPRGDLEPLSEARREADRRRQPTAVVVAGMHRSGTSALARVLSLLGLDLPKTIYEAREDNPLGYWEPEPVIEAHEVFLAEVGSSMDDVLAFGDTALRGPAARTLEDRLVEILGQEF